MCDVECDVVCRDIDMWVLCSLMLELLDELPERCMLLDDDVGLDVVVRCVVLEVGAGFDVVVVVVVD